MSTPSTAQTVAQDIQEVLQVGAATAAQLSPNSTGTKVLSSVTAIEPTILSVAAEVAQLFKAIFAHNPSTPAS